LKRLGDEHGETRFLADLIRKGGVPAGAGGRGDLCGSESAAEKNVPEVELAEVAQVPYPIFYMNYNLYPRMNPWRDAIGSAVRFMKGYEYSITRRVICGIQ
jgi:hypothetical protein